MDAYQAQDFRCRNQRHLERVMVIADPRYPSSLSSASLKTATNGSAHFLRTLHRLQFVQAAIQVSLMFDPKPSEPGHTKFKDAADKNKRPD